MFQIAAWLVFGTALATDASQSVRAIPYASFERCEREMERTFREATRITIKPYCTTVEPSFWVKPQNASKSDSGSRDTRPPRFAASLSNPGADVGCSCRRAGAIFGVA